MSRGSSVSVSAQQRSSCDIYTCSSELPVTVALTENEIEEVAVVVVGVEAVIDGRLWRGGGRDHMGSGDRHTVTTPAKSLMKKLFKCTHINTGCCSTYEAHCSNKLSEYSLKDISKRLFWIP